MAAAVETRLDELAHHLFDVVTRFCLAVPRGRKRSGDLKEIEFLALSLLNQRETLIVGDIQRQLGVLPAQMSRVIRALESRDRPLIACKINAHDKRKIDVMLTPEGKSAFREYQAARVKSIAGLLRKLDDSEREDLGRLAGRVTEALKRLE